MKRQARYGLVCPDDGGILLSSPDWGERLWCPSNGHGGNGRFFDPAEVKEGYEVTSGTGLTAKQERALKASAQEMRDAAEPAAAEPAAAEPKPRRGKDPRDCECGCGGQTKGGRFIPGHDAKLHARQKAEAKALAEAQQAVGLPD